MNNDIAMEFKVLKINRTLSNGESKPIFFHITPALQYKCSNKSIYDIINKLLNGDIVMGGENIDNIDDIIMVGAAGMEDVFYKTTSSIIAKAIAYFVQLILLSIGTFGIFGTLLVSSMVNVTRSPILNIFLMCMIIILYTFYIFRELAMIRTQHFMYKLYKGYINNYKSKFKKGYARLYIDYRTN